MARSPVRHVEEAFSLLPPTWSFLNFLAFLPSLKKTLVGRLLRFLPRLTKAITVTSKGSELFQRVLENPLVAELVLDFLPRSSSSSSLQSWSRSAVSLEVSSRGLRACSLGGCFESIVEGHGVRDGRHMNWLSSRCRDLKRLSLAHPMCWDRQWHRPNALDDGLRRLASLSSLEVLNFEGHQGFGSDALRVLVSSTHTLQEVNLSKCGAVDDDVVQTLLRTSPDLSSLAISRCIHVSDFGLLGVGPALRFIDVSHTNVGDETLRAVAQQASRLEHLDVNGCAQVTDAGILAIAAACSGLKAVHMSRTAAGDPSVLALARGCPTLELIDVCHNSDVTDLSMTHLAEYCPRLETVAVSWCLGVTDVSVQALVACCPQITKLEVRDCFAVTDISLSLVREARPECKILEF